MTRVYSIWQVELWIYKKQDDRTASSHTVCFLIYLFLWKLTPNSTHEARLPRPQRLLKDFSNEFTVAKLALRP